MKYRSLWWVIAHATLLSAGCDSTVPAPPVPNGASYSTDTHPSAIPLGNRGSQRDPLDAGADGGDGGWAPPDDPNANVRLARNEAFDGYLVDAEGRALYMSANDFAGAKATTCLGTCANEWPPFDAPELHVGRGLESDDFKRFHRDDGRWQTSYRGHPLYYYSADEDRSARGDGVGGHWFVARDYFVFLAARPNVAPENASTPVLDTPFLTTGSGHTLYVYRKDTPSTDAQPALSACTGTCLTTWHVWAKNVDLHAIVVPSSVEPTDFAWFTRDGDVNQLTFRGWPLYTYQSDDLPGESSGHNVGEWRVFDPTSFADPTAPSE